MFKKPVYVAICISDLSKVLMYEFHSDILKINMVKTQNYYSLTLIVSCMKLKRKMFMKILVKTKNIQFSELFCSQNIMMLQASYLLVKWKVKQMMLLLKNLLDFGTVFNF